MVTPNPFDANRGFTNPDLDDDEECPVDPSKNTPSRIFASSEDEDENTYECQPPRREQVPVDLIDEESMESFPCSDPPSYSHSHS